MTTLAEIGRQLAAARTKRGLFKTELAEKARVSRNTIHNLENGMGNVELNTLIALCDSMGLDIVLVPKEVSDKAAAEGVLQQSSLSKMLMDRLNALPKKGKP